MTQLSLPDDLLCLEGATLGTVFLLDRCRKFNVYQYSYSATESLVTLCMSHELVMNHTRGRYFAAVLLGMGQRLVLEGAAPFTWTPIQC